MMKKFNLFLFFLFSFFLIKTNVFALDTTGTWFPSSITSVYTDYTNDGDGYISSDSGLIDADALHFRTSDSRFGHLSSGSSIDSFTICNSPTTCSNDSLLFPFTFQQFPTTSSSGIVTIFQNIYNTRSITYNIPVSTIVEMSGRNDLSTSRYDFSLSFDFVNLTQKAKDYIFGKLSVNLSYNQTACSVEYHTSTYIIDISCMSTQFTADIPVFIDFNLKDDSLVQTGTYTNSGFKLRSTKVYYILSPSDDISSLEIGNSMDDYYKKIDIYSNSLFDKFDTSDLHGLSQVITAPLLFISNLSDKNYNGFYSSKYNAWDDPFAFTIRIFRRNIRIPSGTIFWKRGSSDFSWLPLDMGNPTYSQSILKTFRSTWNIVFGGWLVYLSLRKLLQVILNVLNPTNIDLEVF